jgi:chromosome segregation ATPase
MPPKRKPPTRTATASAKQGRGDETTSPAPNDARDPQASFTPLFARLSNRKSSEGKPLDLNMSGGRSSIEHGDSPAWKRSRSDSAGYSAQTQGARGIGEPENSAPSNVKSIIESQVTKYREMYEKEMAARQALEDELANASSAGSDRKRGANSNKQISELRDALKASEKAKSQLEKEVARITEEKELLENQYDDALNSTLISFKSPGAPGGNRKSIGRLSLSGYADEFASLGMSNAEVDQMNKKVSELEHIVERQAEEIERLVKKGSADDSYDMEGLDQKYSQVLDQLDGERSETTKFREEASRLSGLVESLTSEKGVLMNRVRKYQEDELAYEATIAELESLQAEAISMRSEIESYKKRCFNNEQSIEQLSKQVEIGKTHIFSLEDRLKVAERDLEAARYDNNALEQVLTRKNTVLNTELNNARTEIRKLRDENGEAKTMNHKLKQENIDLSTNCQRWSARANEFEAKFHDSENESKRSRAELDAVKRETAIALRNAEMREQEMSATLMDNQTEMGNLSTELRNVKNERDHLLNQVRNMTDQIHEMKHSNAELMNETQKKHEADLVALRQKSNELEALLQSARREKTHYENQFKALSKQGTAETQSALARVKEVEQALEAQKKLNQRLQKEASTTGSNVVEQTTAAAGGKQVSVLGSPAVEMNAGGAPIKRALQPHVSQPSIINGPSPVKQLQRHPTAPIVEQTTVPAVPAPLPREEVAAPPPVQNNPLAFWKAKINSGKPPVAPPAAAPGPARAISAAQPAAAARTPVQRPQTPVGQNSVSKNRQLAPLRTNEVVAPAAGGGSPADKRELSMVEEVQRELEGDETHLSPIQVVRTSIAPLDGMMELEKENGAEEKEAAAPTPRANDAYMRVWNTALASRPAAWQGALSRVAGGNGLDMFQFGSKTLQCRIIGSDMLIIDGKTQTLVDRFLDQYGETLATQQVASSSSNSQEVTDAGHAGNSQGFSQQTTGEPAKRGGLRFKNLRKQPLGNTNDMETS